MLLSSPLNGSLYIGNMYLLVISHPVLFYSCLRPTHHRNIPETLVFGVCNSLERPASNKPPTPGRARGKGLRESRV